MTRKNQVDLGEGVVQKEKDLRGRKKSEYL
jgi:hypothetical protein